MPEEESRLLIRQAVEVGINFFDTANDLYRIHCWAPTPVEETLEALHDVVKAGKAR